MSDGLINPAHCRRTLSRGLYVGGVFGLLCASLLVPLPLEGRAASAVADLLHAPTFAGVTWLINRVLLGKSRAFQHRILLAITIFLLASALEFSQPYVGREGSLQDGVANALGILAGTTLVLGQREERHRMRRWGARGTAALSIGLASFWPLLTLVDTIEQRAAFPVLASFETERELTRWSEYFSDMTRSTQHATHGRWAVKGTWLPADYPALILRDLQPDWTGYRTLAMDLHVEPGTDITVTITVADGKHNRDPKDRYHFTARTTGGTLAIRIPLEEIARGPRTRKLDLTDIAWVGVGADPVEQPRGMGLDHLRLE
jgi:hypothetical protein